MNIWKMKPKFCKLRRIPYKTVNWCEMTAIRVRENAICSKKLFTTCDKGGMIIRY